jgi:hypothetical protein
VLCLRLSQRGKEVARLQRHAPKQQRSDGLRCACEHLSATCTQRPQRTSVHAGVLTPGATLCWGARPCQVPTVNTPLHRKIETSKQSARNAGRMIEQSHTAASHLRIFQRSTFLYLRKGASEQHKLAAHKHIVQGDCGFAHTCACRHPHRCSPPVCWPLPAVVGKRARPTRSSQQPAQ